MQKRPNSPCTCGNCASSQPAPQADAAPEIDLAQLIEIGRQHIRPAIIGAMRAGHASEAVLLATLHEAVVAGFAQMVMTSDGQPIDDSEMASEREDFLASCAGLFDLVQGALFVKRQVA